MALGASGRQVTRLFVRQALVPVGIGAVGGLAAALAIGRGMATLLFEIRAGDPTTLLAASGVLATVGVLAAYLPARRASRLDPVRALRTD